MKELIVWSFVLSACSAPGLTSSNGNAASVDQGVAVDIPHRIDRPNMAVHSTQVEYFGGKVIANAKVYVVWWGNGQGINPLLTQSPGGIADFYAGVLDSNFIDGLNEYDTTVSANAGSKKGAAGSGQHIGRGNYAGTIALTAVPTGNVTDDQIQAAIEAGITQGALPAPDDNTLYALFFPASVNISLDGDTSCGSWLAYHDSTTTAHHVAYAVMPDCGDDFPSFTVTSSHELAEAITDVVPTPGSTPDYPQAWNTSDGSEIADLCEVTSGDVSTPLGSFTVQGLWDTLSGKCLVTHNRTQDYNVAQTSGAVTLQAGGASQTVTFQTTTVAGAAQPLALTVQAPAGVTATLASSSATSGATVTVTLTAAAGVSVTDGQLVLLATGTSGSGAQTHTAAALVSVR